MNRYTSIILVIGILILVNLLSKNLFFRLDLTEDKQYTLSNATKNIVKNLNEPVTITAYFSDNLPPDVAKTKQDFKEMLVEYSNLSKGMIDYEFINPGKDDATEKEAMQSGINSVMINVREKDQIKQQKAFLGAALKQGERQEVIPFIQPGTAMEYVLSTSIKKLSVKDKPSIGFIQGHGEPALSELSQAYQSLSILYNVEQIDLNTADIAPRFKAVAIVAPTDSFPPDHFQKLDNYLSQGGKLFIANNSVQGNFQTAQGTALTTGLESWLSSKGLDVPASFVIDNNAGSVTVQQKQGMFTRINQVKFPYLPLINNFADHPITKGIEQVILQFASPINFTGDSSTLFTPIAMTSTKSGIIPAPTFFDVMNKRWSNTDFPNANLVVGGILEGNIAGNMPSKIVLITDGDFAVTGQQGRGQNKDNINLLVNSIDWLSDDTGLIELRTKGVTTRPIKQEYLVEEADGKRNFIKFLNFGLPIILIILYGIFRMQRQKNIRIKRMQENY